MSNADIFFEEQLASWPLAKGNFEALKGVEQKTVGEMTVQFNPARIVSTGAKMDAKTLAERPCFLCGKNRPKEQKEVDMGEYLLLVNPFPIFPRHFTIAAKDHCPQRIAGSVTRMAEIAGEMPGYTVFYNGPRCGASAPDHKHFQAGNSDFLPIWKALPEVPEGKTTLAEAFGGMGVAVINAATPEEAGRLFDELYKKLPDIEGEEPMMNILARKVGDRFIVVVIPRKRHRPSFYGTEAGQMLVSPASVDLGGVLITPRREDFDAVDEKVTARILGELCYNLVELKKITEWI